MRFLTWTECQAHAQKMGIGLAADTGLPALVGTFVRLEMPARPYQVYPLNAFLAETIMYRAPCLLWLLDWESWPSSHNWSLYYRLRQSYGDHRLLQEAPGHYFHSQEPYDLATMLQLVQLSGWEALTITEAGYNHLLTSHEGWIDVYGEGLDSIADRARRMSILNTWSSEGPVPPSSP